MNQLTDDNFLLFAIKHYDNPSCCGMKDLNADLKRIKYVKRLLRRYARTHEISENLLINHLIVLHNLFGIATVDMLFFKIETIFWPQLKTFLVFLNYMAETQMVEIMLDPYLISKLRKL
jgi:hypothetical protein